MPALILSLAELSARILPTSVKRWLYRTPWLAKRVRQRLNEAVPAGLTQTVVAAGPLKGVFLLLDLQHEKDYWLGTYEMELMAGIADLVPQGSIAYDLGANIGYVSLMLARCVGEQGRVYAFEALPSNQERLKQDVQLNKLEDVVILVPAAVSDLSSVLRFMVAPSGGMGKVTGSAGRHTVEYVQTIDVDGISLDDFVYLQQKPEPDVIKIDIEGGEVLALPGMRRILKEKRPVLFLELHGPEAASVVWQELDLANYRLCTLEAGYPEVEALEKMDWKSYLVAFPRSEYGRN